MGKKLVIGSSGQIGVELIEQLAKDFGANQVIAADIKPILERRTQGVEYVFCLLYTSPSPRDS